MSQSPLKFSTSSKLWYLHNKPLSQNLKKNVIIPLVLLVLVWFDIRIRRNKFVVISRFLCRHLLPLDSKCEDSKSADYKKWCWYQRNSSSYLSLTLAKLLLCPTGWCRRWLPDGILFITVLRVCVTLSPRRKIFPRSRQEVIHLDWLELTIWLEWLLAWDTMVQQVVRKKTKRMMMRKQRGAGFLYVTSWNVISSFGVARPAQKNAGVFLYDSFRTTFT